MRRLRPAIVLALTFTALCGLAYPLAMTALAQAAMPARANALARGAVGQRFSGAAFFWARPSATSKPYDAEASSASNLGPTNPAFLAAVKERVAALRAAHPDQRGPVPADLVTASASGLDPDISVAAARYQAARVASARGVGQSEILALIDEHTQPRWLGVFGEPRVNVVRLNAALPGRDSAPRLGEAEPR